MATNLELVRTLFEQKNVHAALSLVFQFTEEENPDLEFFVAADLPKPIVQVLQNDDETDTNIVQIFLRFNIFFKQLAIVILTSLVSLGLGEYLVQYELDMRSLLTHLRCEKKAIVKSSLILVDILVEQEQTCRDELLQFGIVPMLVQLADTYASDDAEWLLLATHAMLYLTRPKNKALLSNFSPALPLLQANITSSDKQIQLQVLWILAYLATSQDITIVEWFVPVPNDYLTKLILLLKSEADIVAPTVRIIGQLCSVDDGITKHMIKYIDLIKDVLLQDVPFIHEVCWALSNIAADPTSTVPLINSNIVPRIMILTKHEQKQVQREAWIVIYNLIALADANSLKYLHFQDCLSSFFTCPKAIPQLAMDAITNVIKIAQESNKPHYLTSLAPKMEVLEEFCSDMNNEEIEQVANLVQQLVQ